MINTSLIGPIRSTSCEGQNSIFLPSNTCQFHAHLSHIYISALPFPPCFSYLRHVCMSRFKNVMTADTGWLVDWPVKQIVTCRTCCFKCAVFLHNSTFNTPGPSNGNVDIWDSGTVESVVGACTGTQTSDGHRVLIWQLMACVWLSGQNNSILGSGYRYNAC